MKARTVRLWSLVHTWTSLVSTLFLLLLCLTGLPLIFHHEIDEALGYAPQPQAAAGQRPVPPQRIVEAALAADSGRVMQYISWDKDEPGLVMAFTNDAVDGKPDNATVRAFDAVSTKLLGPVGTGPMLIVLKLHTDMFAGQAGKLFLGGMGLLFAVAIVSGVVLYWPFTRRLSFATIRKNSSRRVGWLDWHNLIGVVTIAWTLVVGLTGVVNTWAELMLAQWKSTELAAMVAPYAGKPPPAHLASLDDVVAQATEAAPGMSIAFIAYPGTPFTSSHHFAAFMRGDTPLTSRLLKPVLLDGETAAVADTRALPAYLQALLVSQPLHFGDYGGMPLKIIWAALDVLTIVVIGSGLYLWFARRSRKAHAPAMRAEGPMALASR
ncbi:PepSY-associated TM helix domain-containing protein [Bradyrhizobium sp. Leo121]|uniref:PepSY-associated TM helix domain-containing protein n=1 Tax=Bradyrhizobium sp. Leo121 TaxID=1571195 RepID=UPI0010292EC4|nr:PepSY-associated TM helix domain-containing protein [Bradyrhizobium sp. Leo121]RZN34171.1 peptidase [Bradyrhizobium sp. Leo121]